MGQLIEKLLLKGKTVNIYFEYHRLAHTSFDDLYLLTKLKDQFVNVNFHPISDMGRFKTILIVKTATGIQRYFTDEVDTLSLSNEWGNNNYLYVDDLEITYTEETRPTVQELMQSVASRCNIIREGIMENTSFPLGDIFDVICRTVDIQDIDLKKIDAILSKEVITIEYSDNFLKSGIGCQILYVLIDTLKQRYDFEIQKISLYLDSKDCYNDRYGLYSYINFTFKDPDVRNKYIIDTFQLMYNLTPEISNVRSDHFRWLRLRNSLGDYVEILPDGGIGRGWIMYGVKYSDIYNDPNVYDPNIYIETTENDILYYIKISERQNNNVHED